MRRILSALALGALVAAGSAAQTTVGPAQDAYLKAAHADAFDNFGWSVDVSGDTAVVGAYKERSAATGVDGDALDESAPQAGAAYVFVRDGGGWSQQAYLKSSHPPTTDGFGPMWFGHAVAVDGDTIAVGSPAENGASPGVNGNQSDQSKPGAGSVHVFVRSGGSWSQEAYLKASNPDQGDGFGSSVALHGDTLVVGAPFEDSGFAGVGAGQNSNSSQSAGAVYVFVRSGGTWSQQVYLKPEHPDPADQFGRSVAVHGDTLVVGAPEESSAAVGVGGDATDDSLDRAGAAYVFERVGSTWSQAAYLKASAPDAHDIFGDAVAVSGDTIAVGGSQEDSAATGVGGDDADDSASAAGAVWLFERVGGSWTPGAYLKPSNTDALDEFGVALALDGDTLAVGSRGEDGPSAGVGGCAHLDSAQATGAVFLFGREAGAWSQRAYLKATPTGVGDLFGDRVALSGDTLLVGAYSEDAAGADPADDSASAAGAAWAFELAAELPAPWTDEGGALAGALGDPALDAAGTLLADTGNAVHLTDAAPSSACAVFVALGSAPVPFKGGTLQAFPIALLRFFATDPAGGLCLPFTAPPDTPPGLELWLQAAVSDPGAPAGVALSNALRAVTP